MNWESLLRYVLIPFPSGEGFSPYRTPGPAVHVGFMALVFYLGSALCFGSQLGWLFAVWIMAGSYLGRDLTIQAHYSAFIALPGLALFVGVLLGVTVFIKQSGTLWDALHAAAAQNPEVTVAVTALLGILQAQRIIAAALAK